MHASQYRSLQSVEILVEFGANINALSLTGESALLSASRADNNAAVLSLLLKKGAEINVQSKSGGHTPLILAAANGYVENVRVLLAAGADVRIKNSAGADALAAATRNNRTDVVKLLQRLPEGALL